jgi:hypothetical protein
LKKKEKYVVKDVKTWRALSVFFRRLAAGSTKSLNAFKINGLSTSRSPHPGI